MISFLHSYRNPAHEAEAAALVRGMAPGLHVYTSHEVRPIVREYERSSTAVIHGYVQPRVAGYLSSLQQALRGIGMAPEALITKSNGGVMSAELGKTACVAIDRARAVAAIRPPVERLAAASGTPRRASSASPSRACTAR